MPRPPGKRPSVSVRVFGACSKRFCARRTIGYRHQPDGFSRGKKLVACFLKLVARISKSEPLIFSLLRCGVNALKISFRFSAPEMSVLRRISHPCRDAIHRGRVARHRIWLRPGVRPFPVRGFISACGAHVAYPRHAIYNNVYPPRGAWRGGVSWRYVRVRSPRSSRIVRAL